MDKKQKEARAAARRLLWSWGNTLSDVERLEEEQKAFLRWANDARDTLRAQNLSGLPRGGARSDLADVVAETLRRARMYEEQVLKIGAEIADRIRLKHCIDELIDRLPPVQRKILAYRYSDGHEWQYIAMKMNYDEASVRRLDRQAVDFISRNVLLS